VPENKIIKTVLIFLIIFGLGGGLGYTLAKLPILDGMLPDKGYFQWWHFTFLFLIYFLVVGIHELGHLLTGLAQGFHFDLFIVGFVGLKKERGQNVELYFNKDLGMAGGVAATSPNTYDETIVDKMARIVIAGPIASLLLSLIGVILAFYVGQPYKFYLFVIALMSLGIFFGTTLPPKTGVFYTDRKRYQRLRSKGLPRDIEMALMQAITLKLTDQPLNQMDYSDLEKITKDESPTFQYFGYFYLLEYWKEEDASQIEGILSEMKKLESQLPDKFIKMLHKEIAKITNP